MRVVDGLFERHRAVGAEQLIICSLRLDRRDDVAQRVDQTAVERNNALGCCAQGLAVQHHVAPRNMLRNVFETGVQTGYGRIAFFLDLFY